VKVRTESITDTLQEDQLADALEADLPTITLPASQKNIIADTDRMLFSCLVLGGPAIKKVYFCPLRGRPVSESVDADDLIVNNAATDLSTAKRITHRVMMRPYEQLSACRSLASIVTSSLGSLATKIETLSKGKKRTSEAYR